MNKEQRKAARTKYNYLWYSIYALIMVAIGFSILILQYFFTAEPKFQDISLRVMIYLVMFSYLLPSIFIGLYFMAKYSEVHPKNWILNKLNKH